MNQVKLTDAKGRLTLGEKFANRSFIVTRQDGSILLTPAAAIPEDELWLFQKHESLKMVLDGLAAARNGTFAESPDFAGDGREDELGDPPRQSTS